VLSTFLVLCTTTLQGADLQNPQQRFDAANKAYNDGSYEEAIGLYRSLIDEFGLSAPLLHNLGNSYANNGRYGHAILQYMRALRITPGDNDIKGDLELIRQKTGLFQKDKSFREEFFSFFDMNQWALLALAGYAAAALLVLLRLRFSLGKKADAACLFFVAVVCISALGAWQQRVSWSGGVVLISDTRLLLSPFNSASSLGIVEEGSLVYAEKQYGAYHYVRDERDRSGWIPSSSFAPIPTKAATYGQDDAVR
jgi:hypothetical protein